jgi:ParB family chromosome partitioning protein
MVVKKRSTAIELEALDLIDIKKLNESPYQGRILEDEDLSKVNEVNKSMAELIESISRSGQMTPIVVRPTGKGYEIIDGHRRVIAHKKLGLKQIKAVITNATDKEAQVMSVVGNLQRKGLSTIELAMSYKKILDSGYYKDKKVLSLALGKDETYVGDVLNTLNMDSRIVDDLAKNNSVKDLKLLRLIRRAAPVDENQQSDQQWELYQKVVQEGLGRAQVKELTAKSKAVPHKVWKTSEKIHQLNIKISTTKLTPEQKEKLKEMLNSKLVEIFGVL